MLMDESRYVRIELWKSRLTQYRFSMSSTPMYLPSSTAIAEWLQIRDRPSFGPLSVLSLRSILMGSFFSALPLSFPSLPLSLSLVSLMSMPRNLARPASRVPSSRRRLILSAFGLASRPSEGGSRGRCS